jgi:DNA-binding LytR/AlgR family response regulator
VDGESRVGGASMVLTIGICDDCPEQIELLRRYLQRVTDGFGLTVISSSDPVDFLAQLKKNPPDLVFLDVEMSVMDGIQLGEKIRAQYQSAIIIYITAYENYALDAFRVRAFHYLLKPLSEEKFTKVFQEALELFKKNVNAKTAPKFFTVRKKTETIRLDYDAIDYFEKIGHKIKVHTANRAVEFYGNFSKLLVELDPNFFVKCHQGYIVNIAKIEVYREKTIILEGNLPIPVSRPYIGNIKEMLAQRLFSGEDES